MGVNIGFSLAAYLGGCHVSSATLGVRVSGVQFICGFGDIPVGVPNSVQNSAFLRGFRAQPLSVYPPDD